MKIKLRCLGNLRGYSFALYNQERVVLQYFASKLKPIYLVYVMSQRHKKEIKHAAFLRRMKTTIQSQL